MNKKVMKKRNRSIRMAALLTAGVFGASMQANALPIIPTYPGGGDGIPVTVGQELFANGGDVTVTYQGWQGAAYDEYLFVYSPPNGFGYFFENHTTPAGTTMDLGTYAAGTEILFGIYVVNTGLTFYDGPGSRNLDGQVHAYMVSNYGDPNTTYVGFEDLSALTGSDFNYKDEVYTFTGVQAASSVPDASSTLPLVACSLTALLGFGRRYSK